MPRRRTACSSATRRKSWPTTRSTPIVVTDSVPPFRLGQGKARDKLVVLSSARLFADAIANIHSGGSIVQLLEVSDPRH